MRSDRSNKRLCFEHQHKRFTNSRITACEVVIYQFSVFNALPDSPVIAVVHKVPSIAVGFHLIFDLSDIIEERIELLRDYRIA